MEIPVGQTASLIIDPSSIKDKNGNTVALTGGFSYRLSAVGFFDISPSPDMFSCLITGLIPTVTPVLLTVTMQVTKQNPELVRRAIGLTCVDHGASTFDFNFALNP
ncbi:MAG: hypothetical protein ACREJN_12350 [Nitrospiraceae bacterium]